MSSQVILPGLMCVICWKRRSELHIAADKFQYDFFLFFLCADSSAGRRYVKTLFFVEVGLWEAGGR